MDETIRPRGSWYLFSGMSPRTKAIVSFSSGKDSALALHEVRGSGDVEVVGILTTIT
jgi:hypothetical protein